MRSYLRHALPAIAVLTSALIFCSAASAQPRGGGGAIEAVDEPAESAGAAVGGGGGGSTATKRVFGTEPKQTSTTRKKTPATTRTKTRTSAAAKPAPAAPKQSTRPYDGFVIGDKYTFLNFEVVSAAKPYHTRAAKASGAKGLVQVEVLISEQGNVLTARARTGNKELHPEAERAALASKFNRPSVYGKPARAMGFLVYRFGPADD